MTAPAPLIPARLTLQADGTPVSEAYGDVYHSSAGGLGQARHVFLSGNRLPARWQGREMFVILETGFGLGLNFLATWQAWEEDPQRAQRLHFISVEKHPFSRADLAVLHHSWPEFDEQSKALLAAWPTLTPGFHRLEFENGRVILTLIFGDVLEKLPQVSASVDAFYLDGFSPAKNPDMWSPSLYKTLSRLAAQDATLATYTVASAVRAGLSQVGFALEKCPGYGRKRDMLTGRYNPPAYRLPRPSATPPTDRRAIVIGAGLAGSAICAQLAARDWQIDLIERHAAPAQEASGNPLGILMPLLSADDNLNSQLLRAGYLAAQRECARLENEGPSIEWNPCGVLQLACDTQQAEQMQAIIMRFNYPSDYAVYLSREAASKRAGQALATGGIYFPSAGVVSPSLLCAARLARYQAQICSHFNQEAITLVRQQEHLWQVRDASGVLIAEAPLVILANATDAKEFVQSHHLPLQRVRGQISMLPAVPSLMAGTALCQEGYLTPPAKSGLICFGASFDFDEDPNVRTDSHATNLEHLAQLLPGATHNVDIAALEGRVAFRAITRDRLPIIGLLPDQETAMQVGEMKLEQMPRYPGLFGLAGFGSRGLAWSSIAADLLASRINHEPMPVEASLASAVDPARFLLRAKRQGRSECLE